MLLASTGLRATEGLSIRLKDLDLESNPAKLIIRGEFTKTKIDRYVFLTKELVQQLKIFIDYKYRKRRICYLDNSTEKNKKTITEYRIPEKNVNNLVFSVYQIDKSRPETLYFHLVAAFAKTLDRIGMGAREDGGNEARRKITLHSLRRFVKLQYLILVIVIILNGLLVILVLHIGEKKIARKQRYSRKLNLI
jgi:integrase